MKKYSREIFYLGVAICMLNGFILKGISSIIATILGMLMLIYSVSETN